MMLKLDRRWISRTFSLVFVATGSLLLLAPGAGAQQLLDPNGAFFISQADAGGTDQDGDEFGAIVIIADLDNDGFEDLTIGAPSDRAERRRRRRRGEQPRSGSVYTFFGSEAGLEPRGASPVSQADAGDVEEEGDRFGAAITVADFNFDGFGDLVVGAPGEALGSDPKSGAVFVFPGSKKGFLPGFVLTQADAGGTNDDGDLFGMAVAAADLDGDGFEDLVVGAPGDAPDGGPRSGTVYIFPGSHQGVGPHNGHSLSQSNVLGETNEEGDLFGWSIATGQFNGFGGVSKGDGFADLAIGAPGEAPGSDPQSGAVFVFLGAKLGVGVVPGIFITQREADGVNEAGDLFGHALSTGDSNNDGVEELAVGAPGEDLEAGATYVFPADPVTAITTGFSVTEADAGGIPEPGDRFGAALAFGVLGNNDNAEELVVGAPGEDLMAGAIFLYPGGPDGPGPGFVITEEDSGGVRRPGSRFGSSLSVEDLNDNKAADVAVGAPGDSPIAATASGETHIFMGIGTSPPATTQEAAGGINEKGDQFGASQVTADFNGDGVSDLAIGAPGEDRGAGAVFVFPGAATTAPGVTVTTGIPLTQAAAGGIAMRGDAFGASLAAGDFDGDGFDDLIAGAPGEDRQSGAVYYFRGSANGLRIGSFITQTAAGDRNENKDRFGTSVTAGDFNADGFEDLAVGATGENKQMGAVFIFPGSLAGLRLGFVINQTAGGDLPELRDWFGSALAAGDFDADGYDDLVVGSSGESTPRGGIGGGAGSAVSRKAGSVFVFPGGEGGIHMGFFLLQSHGGGGNLAGGLFGSALTVGDFDGDGFDDLAAGAPGINRSAGTVFVFPGSTMGLQAGFPVTESEGGNLPNRLEFFGASLAAGDFNDDGFSDLVVGAPGEGIPGRRRQSFKVGAVFLFHGTETGIGKGFAHTESGAGGAVERGDLFGTSVATGDFDDDGLDDLAVGAPGEALGLEPKSGALFTIDDEVIDKLYEEFLRLQETQDPLPPI